MKAIEAAAREMTPAEERAAEALWEIICDDAPGMTISTLNRATVLAIRAYLSALKEDPEVIKRVGDEIHHWTVLNMEWGPIGYDRIARAALSAIEVE